MKTLFAMFLLSFVVTHSSVARAAPPLPPVALTYLGLDDAADPQGTRLRLAVNADHVSQVDIGLVFFDKSDRKLGEETYAWQNVVKSKKLPIEAGKTYETDRGPFEEGAVRAEATLLRVIYADGTRWNAR